MPGDREPRNTFEAFGNAVVDTLDSPVTWFRGLLFSLNVLKTLKSALSI